MLEHFVEQRHLEARVRKRERLEIADTDARRELSALRLPRRDLLRIELDAERIRAALEQRAHVFARAAAAIEHAPLHERPRMPLDQAHTLGEIERRRRIAAGRLDLHAHPRSNSRDLSTDLHENVSAPVTPIRDRRRFEGRRRGVG